jgi:hypothetical protein
MKLLGFKSGGSGGGSGIDGTTVYIECGFPPPNEVGTNLAWDSIYDNDGNALSSVPTNLGLAFDPAIGGGNEALITTQDGIWAFTLAFYVNDNITPGAVARVTMFFGTFLGRRDLQIPVDAVYFQPMMEATNVVKMSANRPMLYVFSAAYGAAFAPLNYALLQITRLA